MLSFELIRDGKAIEIQCDDRGIDALIDVLGKLRGSGSHIHLLAPSHGGGSSAALSDMTPYGQKAIAEVIISHGGD
jgi:hypothetical protein